MDVRVYRTEDGAEIAYRMRSGSSPWILLHALGCDGSLWDGMIAFLPAGCGLLVPDLRGHGGSTLGWALPSVDRWARDVWEIADREGIVHPAVAGISMGGYVALALAARRPEGIRSLGLVSTTARADDEAGRARRAEGLATLRRVGWEALARGMLPELLNADHPEHGSIRDSVLAAFGRAGDAGLASALLALAHRQDRRRVLVRLGVPVVAIAGDRDTLTPPERAREMAVAAPRGSLVVLGGVAHLSALEAPGEVARALLGADSASISSSGPGGGSSGAAG